MSDVRMTWKPVDGPPQTVLVLDASPETVALVRRAVASDADHILQLPNVVAGDDRPRSMVFRASRITGCEVVR